VNLDSKHSPVEIPFEPAAQPEDTEAQGAQNALDLSETIGKAHPKINIRTLTKAHITDVKARVLGDATAGWLLVTMITTTRRIERIPPAFLADYTWISCGRQGSRSRWCGDGARS